MLTSLAATLNGAAHPAGKVGGTIAAEVMENGPWATATVPVPRLESEAPFHAAKVWLVACLTVPFARKADVRHTIGNTTFGLGLRYERDDIDNSLNILRRFGETNRIRAVTQKDSTEADIFSSRAFVETRFSPQVLFTVGGSYTRLDTDVAGSRIYGPTYNSALDPCMPTARTSMRAFTI